MHAITLPITKVIKYLRVSKYIKADIYTVQLDSTDSNGCRRFEHCKQGEWSGGSNEVASIGRIG